jgi:hypothetical protein
LKKLMKCNQGWGTQGKLSSEIAVKSLLRLGPYAVDSLARVRYAFLP